MGLTESDIRRIFWTFVQAFLGGLVTGLAAWANVPQGWNAWKAALLGLIVGAVAAAISAVKNLFLDDGSSLK
jgi:membrane associated rhomboid family serine protease